MKRLKHESAIVCEYIAEGQNGKHTIVNMYSGDITVAEFPAIIPLAFYIELLPDADTPEELHFEIRQNKKVVAKISAKFQFAPGLPAVIVVPQMAVRLEKPSTIRVVGMCEGYQDTVLLSKRIYLSPQDANEP